MSSTDANEGAKARVLVVDDDAILRRVLRTALAQGGFDVAQVGSGRDALHLAEAYEFELIITDLQMPGMDGVALLRALRERRVYSPVIVMSGAPEAQRADILAVGAFEFLPKPFNTADLLAVARQAVSRPQTIAPPSSVVVSAKRVCHVA
jgi:DNA-binding response OmpR family regulator